ncbi:MAG: hypothetical protein Q7Q73_06170 [Verrucomicrobiota bacterium JB024]|nr:hypothetical protein [Verrucomicrobiota bacterium JB024]
MDYQIDKQTWGRSLAERYPLLPATGKSFRDGRYRTMERDEAVRLYDEFHPWIRAILEPHCVYQWVQNKADCDFWSRIFIAYVLIRNAMGHTELKPALAEIHFRLEPANPYSGHSICSFADRDGLVWELDPQPNCGLFPMSHEQAATCYSFDA